MAATNQDETGMGKISEWKDETLQLQKESYDRLVVGRYFGESMSQHSPSIRWLILVTLCLSFIVSGCDRGGKLSLFSSYEAPTVPTGVAATAGNGQVSLSWTAPVGDFGSLTYNLLRGASSGSETSLVTGVTSTSYIDPDVSNGNTYYYVIVASGSGGDSSNSAEVSATPLLSQPLFTWMGGANSAATAGTYGTKGVASSSNVIGGREAASFWGNTAVSGAFWLFGGSGYDHTGSSSALGDLWYHVLGSSPPSTSTRTWLAGANVADDVGVYGSLGATSTTYSPGSRYSAGTWTDLSGNLWLLGGYGYDSSGNTGTLDDLWVYFPTTQEWTWVAGSGTAGGVGSYGPVGTPSASYWPKARSEFVTWTDSTGHLWLYGGSSGGVKLSDLWKFTIGGDGKSGTWTLVRGSSTSNVHASYGTQGVPSDSNTPGGRANSATWIDGTGRLWLFGGYSSDYLGDLWFYSPAADRWVWVAGDGDQQANHGTRGVGSSARFPGARAWTSQWIDSSGYLWLFGGYGYDSANSETALSDLWVYNPGAGQWTWAGGPQLGDQNAVYGTLATSDAANIPGGRYKSGSWSDSSGNFWLFGGGGYDGSSNWDDLNDLWKIQTVNAVGPLQLSQITSVYAATQFAFSASGGTPPYTFSIASGGGSITAQGIFTAPIATGSVTIQVEDAAGKIKTAVTTIYKDPLTLSSDVFLWFSGAGGVLPYAYSVVSGGGTIDATTGHYAPPVGATGSVTIRVTDAAGVTADATHAMSPFQFFPVSGTFTVPSGVTQIKVLVIGGGGGGGASRCHLSGGGGGGSGYVNFNTYSVTAGTTYSVTVGAGGTGDLANPEDGPNGGLHPDAGGDGESSSFDSLLTSAGGIGGYDSYGGCGPGGEGGAGENAGGDGSLSGSGSLNGQNSINGALASYFTVNAVTIGNMGIAATSSCGDISEGGGGGAGLLIGGNSKNTSASTATVCVGGTGGGVGGGGGGGTRWEDAKNGADGGVYIEY